MFRLLFSFQKLEWISRFLLVPYLIVFFQLQERDESCSSAEILRGEDALSDEDVEVGDILNDDEIDTILEDSATDDNDK